MAEDVLYKPRQIYNGMLKNQFHDEAQKLFDDLAAATKVDQGGNKVHVNAYKAAKAVEDAFAKKVRTRKVWAGILLALSILIAVVGVILLFLGQTWAYIVGPVLIGLGIVGIIIRVVKIRKSLKENEKELAKLQAESKAKLDICYEDMAALNAAFDWNMPCQIMNKATDLLKLDPCFTNERYQYLVDGFGYNENDNYLTSVMQVTSGSINGNPFILEKVHSCEIQPKTYTGSLVITWTVTRRDSEGHTYTSVEHETLYATIEKPAPFYELTTRIVYGNEAAPHLTFSRYPSGASGKTDKQIENMVKAKSKALDKQEKKALKKGQNFTKMSNDEFDTLFGANDRNDEVEFRLLFTPLAQQNELDLIKNKDPYGDDFVMMKDKMITSVASSHSQHFDYSANPALFYGYDFEEMRVRFVKYCDDYIRGLYFDLAPIMAIPLYQMHQPHAYVYKEQYPQYFPYHEHEVFANGLGQDRFRPAEADASLPVMLKAMLSTKKKDYDLVQIKGTSYKTIPHTEYVAKMGRDGHTHMVPVEWTEYIEVQKDSYIGMGQVGGSNAEVYGKLGDNKEGTYFERGIASTFIGEKANDKFVMSFEKLKESIKK